MKSETLEDFYKRYAIPQEDPQKKGVTKDTGLVNIYRREAICGQNATPYNRRDYYKISLVIGKGVLSYADKGIEIDKPALLFSNPLVPYSWEPQSTDQRGYFCLFKDNFINSNVPSQNIPDSPLFKIGGNPVYFLNKTQEHFIDTIFTTMLDEINSSYVYKYDLIHNYIHIIMHEALKMQPADSFFQHNNASSRIATLFIELLERQFPIDSPQYILKLKTPSDFASRLSVHVNHLNRSVKEITGKTTTEHISERVIQESKALLKYTSWNINEIAYALGFEYPSYFTNFFRRQTNATPKSFRN